MQVSRAHQSVRKRSMQAAKLSEDGGVSSQPTEVEESSQSKTAKRGMLVSWDDDVVPRLLMVERVLHMVVPSSVFALWLLQKVWPLPLRLLALVLMLALVLTLTWYEYPRTNYRHMHNTEPPEVVRLPVVPRVLVLVHVMVLGVVVRMRMLSLQWQEALAVVAAAVLPLIFDRVVDFWCESRLVTWGPHEWVLDSGAGTHRTSNPLVVLEGLQFHEIANPRVKPGLGSVRMERFEFPGVRYVAGDNDEDARNVVSVSQLARDHGLVTVFEPTSCHVKDKKTGQIVGKGRLRNGMYMLDYLRVVGQYIGAGLPKKSYIGHRGASSGGERGDGRGGGKGHGGRGNNGEGRGGVGRSRDGMEGGTRANRNQGQGDSGSGSGSGAAEGDINDEDIVKEEEVEEVEEEGSNGNEIQEMSDENIDENDNGRIHQGMNGNGEDEDKKRGERPTIGESSNEVSTGMLCYALVCLGIAVAASILFLASRRTGVKCKIETFIDNLDIHNPLVFSFLFFMMLPPLRNLSMMQPTSRKLVTQIGSLFRGRSREYGVDREGIFRYYFSSHRQHNRRLFGLSRFEVTTDRTGYRHRQLPAGAFPTSTYNTARWEDFFVDSGASYHTTWKESILLSYPQHLENHTKPPTQSLGGIAAGSIEVTRSGYLNINNIMLDGVLLALDAQANLVSVGQLSIYYGVKVEMDDVGVVIKKKQDGVQIGGGRMLNNLYVLEYFQPGGLFAYGYTPRP